MKKLLIILMIGSLATLAFAAFGGTDEGTAIDNDATASGANFNDVTDGASTTVLGIDGGNWTCPVDNNAGTAGTRSTFITWLSNCGNETANEVFNIALALESSSGADAGAAWTQALTNVTDGGALNPATATIARGGVKQINMLITVSADALSASWRQYTLIAIPDAGAGTDNGYTGDNALNYGGTMGDNGTGGEIQAGYVPNQGAGANTEIRLTVQGPTITVTKTIEGYSNPSGFGAGAYPGHTITYRVYIENTGAGAANNLFVYDAAPANTTIVAGVLKLQSGADESGTTYATAGGVLTDAADDDNASTAGGNVEWIPNSAAGNLADTVNTGDEDGTMSAAGGATDTAVCYYQVTID